MINELFQLSEALDRAGIDPPKWHREYKPIPGSQCIRVSILNGKVKEISYVKDNLQKELRKYGSNQATYPCMNIVPLYKVSDERDRDFIEKIKPEEITDEVIQRLEKLCVDSNYNWDCKFLSRYKNCIKKSYELCRLVPDYKPIQILSEQSRALCQPEDLHKELKNAAFTMLNERNNTGLALEVLFHLTKSEKKDDNDSGKLSIAFESEELFTRCNMRAISRKFVGGLNNALLKSKKESGERDIDAFGISYAQLNEPMPEAKLAGGIQAKIRTMYGKQKSQVRYGKSDDNSYPLSDYLRTKLHSSLEWLGAMKHKQTYWSSIDKGELLFVYPCRITNHIESCVNFLHPIDDTKSDLQENEKSFEIRAKAFISELRVGKDSETDSNADHVQIFVLKKLDKARTKIVYNRKTDARELEKCCEDWVSGSRNLPTFPFGSPKTPFPIGIADVFNTFWKQNGDSFQNKYQPIERYHGLDLLLEPSYPRHSELHMLSEKMMTISPYLGNALSMSKIDYSNKTQCMKWWQIKSLLAIAGILLYQKSIRKEEYMEDFPYQYGQLLKVSDELHAMYCRVVRNRNLPAQFVGSTLYQAAAEAPLRTLSVLGQRMNPYIAWAKTYDTNEETKEDEHPALAKWLLRKYEDVCEILYQSWTKSTRFSDEERAQFFIGYLAALPKSKKNKNDTNPNQQGERNQEEK